MANELKHGSVGVALSDTEWESVTVHVFDGQVTGDIPYASSATQLSRLADVPAGQPLVSQGVGVAPAYATSMGAMTFTGLVTLGAQKLGFTNGIIKTDSNYDIQLRNSGDTGYGNLRMNNLYFNSRLIADTDGGDLSAPNVDSNYFLFKARDNGVGLGEVGRLQGAADPEFQLGLNGNALRASYAGYLGFFNTAPQAKPTGVAVTAAGIHAALVTLGLIAA